MMKIGTLAAAMILLAPLLATPASAQVRAGLNELGATIIVDADDSSESVWSIDLTLLYGRFVTDRWQLGGEVGFYEANEQDLEGDYRGFAAYHFGGTDKTAVPYAEASLGRFFGGGGEHPTFAAAGPGLKVFFAGGGGALDLAALYRRLLDSSSTTGKNAFNFTIGGSVFFE